MTSTGTTEITVSFSQTMYHLRDTLEAEVSITCVSDSCIYVPDPDSFGIEFSTHWTSCSTTQSRIRVLSLNVRAGTSEIITWDKLIMLKKGETSRYLGRLALVAPEFWMADSLLLTECWLRYTPCSDAVAFLMRGNEWVGVSGGHESSILHVRTLRPLITGPFIYILEAK